MTTATEKRFYEVQVEMNNVAHLVVEANSAEDAEKMVAQWIRRSDPRFYQKYDSYGDGDSFNPDTVEAEPLDGDWDDEE